MLSGELSMMRGAVLAEELAAGSAVSSPALSRLAVAAARTLRLNNVFPFNLPLLKKGLSCLHASGSPNPSCATPPLLWSSNCGAATSRRQQAAARAEEIRINGGSSLRQRSCTKGHLGLKGHAPITRGALSTLRVALLPPLRKMLPMLSGSGAEATSKLGVRVSWLLRELLGRAAFYDLAGVHDEDFVGEISGRRDVMGYVEKSQLEPVSQVVKEVEHFETDRDVEHRYRFVGQEHARVGSQGTGERHPLALAARQLVGVLGQELLGRREVDLLHQGRELGVELAFRPFVLVQFDRSLEVVTHRVHRVQRRERVLEYELHFAFVLAEVTPVRTTRPVGRLDARHPK